MTYPLRHSICNEIFHPPGEVSQYTFEAACRKIREIGYTGIEIAPFTLSDQPQAIPAAERKRLRETIVNEGLQFAGLHWLMLSPKGLQHVGPRAFGHDLEFKSVFAS